MTQPLDALLADLADDGIGAARREEVVDALFEMVRHPDYPCLGARSVVRRDAVTTAVLEDLGDTRPGGSLDRLGELLASFVTSVDPDEDLVSFVACFRSPGDLSERGFERTLWTALQHLHDHDDQPWAEGVAADPDNPHFAFSLAGTAFFVVGLHPHASRVARRAPVPTLVFNLHEQFERMRTEGRFDRMRDTIRRRDTELQGTPNPMAVDHGEASEARQYSGRAVPDGWRAPFVPEPTTPTHSEETP